NWVTMGGVTKEFETLFAEKIQARHALAVANGTAALHLALMAVGIRPGDEVLVPSLTFVACANVIVALGAKPVFIDVGGESDLTLSPRDMKNKITENTRAVIAVHYAGFPCQMDAILPLAQKHELKIIEDCAHAAVSTQNGTYCGCFGDIGCFSFFSNKNMTTAEGGMLTTNNDEHAETLRLLRSHGMTTLTLDRYQGRAFSYDVTMPGLNYRIDEIRSAIGLSQLKRLDDNLEQRRGLFSAYVSTLSGVQDIIIPFLGRQNEMIGHHIFPILVPEGQREDFMRHLKEAGIQTSIHYPPIHKFTAYCDLLNDRDPGCPITENVTSREVTLPFYPAMKKEQIAYIGKSIREFFER
ncbi:aminotransferase class I/II-fold pyridoxal phosphate-dependent enzyme, partial [bacterium]|nr:aminotransferase class I/II-fold pyridoxal phosphate-dependent enzyme [bacterium]